MLLYVFLKVVERGMLRVVCCLLVFVRCWLLLVVVCWLLFVSVFWVLVVCCGGLLFLMHCLFVVVLLRLFVRWCALFVYCHCSLAFGLV